MQHKPASNAKTWKILGKPLNFKLPFLEQFHPKAVRSSSVRLASMLGRVGVSEHREEEEDMTVWGGGESWCRVLDPELGKKGFPVREGTAVTGSLLTFRRIDQIGKYIKDNGSLVSHCPRRELQI